MELRSVEAIAKALNQAQIRYIVVGGIAVNVHGYERFTNDVDLVISLEPGNVRRALETLISIGYAPGAPISPEEFSIAENRRRWQEEKSMLVLKLWSDKHRRTPIDVFINEPFDFDVEWAKVKKHHLNEEDSMPIVSYETLLEMKRVAGRDRDLVDIASLQKLDSYRDV